MKLRWPQTVGGRCLAVCSSIVAFFLAGALLSRALSSLGLVNDLLGVCFVLFLLFVLALPFAGLVALVMKRTRKWILIFAPSLAVALALSTIALRWLGCPQERALELLIERFDPIVGAIDYYKRDHGRPPAKLDDLVPDYLGAIPKGELLGDELEPRYDIDIIDSWSIDAGGYVWKIFDGPVGEVEYRSDQVYEELSPKEAVRRSARWGLYRGWHWLIWE